MWGKVGSGFGGFEWVSYNHTATRKKGLRDQNNPLKATKPTLPWLSPPPVGKPAHRLTQNRTVFCVRRTYLKQTHPRPTHADRVRQ